MSSTNGERSGLTYQDEHSLYQARYRNVASAVTGVIQRPGVSREAFLEAERMLAQLQGISRTFGAAWKQIQDAKQQAERGSLLEASLDAVLELHDDAAALYRRAEDETRLREEGSALQADDLAEFSDARNYHRKQAVYLLAALGGVLIGGIGLVVYVFGLVSPNSVISTSAEGPHGWAELVLVFGGRVSILAFVGWCLAFLGRLHSAHAAQAVTYQDRVSGLRAGELILRRGSREGRRAVISTMAQSYLALDRNAFSTRRRKDDQEDTFDTAERTAKLIGSVVKSIPR